MQNAECKMQNVRCKMQNYKSQNVGVELCSTRIDADNNQKKGGFL